MSSFLKGAAVFMGGAIAGVAAALLISPEKKDEMRKELNDLAQKAKKRAQEFYEEASHRATEKEE